jgi:hypothetical protein
MRLNADAKVSYAQAFIFQPYPGTELGKFTQDNDLTVGSFDDISSISWNDSILIFKDEDEKRQIEHLQRWFAIGVEFPWLQPLIRRLIKLPHHPLVDTSFWWIHKLFKGYLINRRVHPTRFRPFNLLNAAKHYFRMDA